jgi:hypothetical protein
MSPRLFAVLLLSLGLHQVTSQTVGAQKTSLAPQQLAIFGTGYVAGGPGLAGEGTVDGNFTLISCPVGAACIDNGSGGYDAFVTLTGQYPFGYWLPNTSSAQWIGPAVGGDEMVLDAVGDYVFRQTFDLTGFDPRAVELSGSFATDNSGYIQLNGVTVGPTSSSNSSLTAFSLTSGFVPGINTLDFIVTNAPPLGEYNSTGLFVELSGIENSRMKFWIASAESMPVPVHRRVPDY